MTNFEKKYGRYAIKDLPVMLILCYGVGYLMQMISPEFFKFLTLDPYQIVHGQIWRVFTWIVIPPSELNLFTFIMLAFYYFVGNTLEKTWGTYRFNVYLFSGMLFTVLGSFVSLAFFNHFFKTAILIPGMKEASFAAGSMLFSTYYINMSILLAFAATFPETEVLLMFVFPIKMKWLGLVYIGTTIVNIIEVSEKAGPLAAYFMRIAVVSSLLNFVVFLISNRKRFKKNNISYFRRRY